MGSRLFAWAMCDLRGSTTVRTLSNAQGEIGRPVEWTKAEGLGASACAHL